MTDESAPRDQQPGEEDGSGTAPVSALARTLAQGVVLTAERVQEAFEDAVRRGRMTRQDAHELAATIVATGRRQTDELRAELEQLVGRGRDRISGGRSGAALPIEGYDEKTAAQIVAALDGLEPAELRRLRDHEAANANRKTVLRQLDRRLDA